MLLINHYQWCKIFLCYELEPHEIMKPTFRSQRNLTNTHISKPQALYQEAQKLEATWTAGLFFLF